MTNFKIKKFPKSRIATNDICAVGVHKHHIVAMIEVDVSESREKLKQLKRKGDELSFTAWLIKIISISITKY